MEFGGYISSDDSTSKEQSLGDASKRCKTGNTVGVISSHSTGEERSERGPRTTSIFSNQQSERGQSSDTTLSSNYGSEDLSLWTKRPSTSFADAVEVSGYGGRQDSGSRANPVDLPVLAPPQHSAQSTSSAPRRGFFTNLSDLSQARARSQQAARSAPPAPHGGQSSCPFANPLDSSGLTYSQLKGRSTLPAPPRLLPLPVSRPAPSASFAPPGFHFRRRRMSHGSMQAQIAVDAMRYGWDQDPLASMANFMTLLERQQKIVDDLANKFRNIVVLAASSSEQEDVTGQEAASKTLNINVETQGLVNNLSFQDWRGNER